MHIIIRLTVFVVLLATVVSGCGIPLVKTETPPVESTGDMFDPFRYGDEFVMSGASSTEIGRETVHSLPDEPSEQNAGDGVESPSRTSDRRSATASTGNGYRVQIGIDANKERMEQLVQYARSRVDYPIYLEFEPPFYRVRVGDFRTREEAEQCVRLLKSEGFDNALWVMSAINVY